MTVTEHAPIPEQDTQPSGPVTLAFFYSPRSGKSRRTEGLLAQVLQRHRNPTTFQLLHLDIDKRPDLAERFRVTETPTLLVIANNRVQARLSEPRGCRQITELLSPWLK